MRATSNNESKSQTTADSLQTAYLIVNVEEYLAAAWSSKLLIAALSMQVTLATSYRFQASGCSLQLAACGQQRDLSMQLSIVLLAAPQPRRMEHRDHRHAIANLAAQNQLQYRAKRQHSDLQELGLVGWQRRGN
jgi:hypothetical protein